MRSEVRGARGSEVNGVFFTEQTIPNAQVKKHIRVKLQGQNRDLNQVKLALAKQAGRVGANAVMNFHYGQKRGFFVWDDMSWVGEGDALTVD